MMRIKNGDIDLFYRRYFMNISLIELIYFILFLSSVIVAVLFITRMVLLLKLSKNEEREHYKLLSIGLLLMFGSYFINFIVRIILIILNTGEFRIPDFLTAVVFLICFIIYSIVLNKILRDNYGEDSFNDHK